MNDSGFAVSGWLKENSNVIGSDVVKSSLVGLTAAHPLLFREVMSSGVLQQYKWIFNKSSVAQARRLIHCTASLLYFSQTLSRNTFHGSWGRNELDSQCRAV
jgi:hypothetical protein